MLLADIEKNRIGPLHIPWKIWILIAVLLEKPDALPGDQRSMKLAVLAAIATNILATLILVESRFLLVEALLDLVLAAGCLYLALHLWGWPERFIQSFSAYCGVSVVLNIASLLLLGLTHTGQTAETVSSFGRFLEYVFLVWSISAVGHIIRHCFEISVPLSIVSALLYLLVYIQLAALFIDL